MIWPMGGSAAVVLADPNDTATKSKVDALLAKLAADPANGIDRVLTEDEVIKGGGLPSAESIVSMASGYELGYQFTPPLITAGTNGGMHGYAPDRPEMRSSFFLVGPGVAKGRSLGPIDMRNIAPTLAAKMGVRLTAAERAALDSR